ncbi:MAG: LytR C-terminal domain-containing protein [Lachnospiraceae bacterium]|nr:LytR C-terminal domain-containing protein [Lachnospiraceae bacterium]MBQ2320688.1 LytR C-terminal domain-containing protein [Lachnospiraceae bacterium]
MKKNNVAKVFMVSLLKSILCILIILGVGVASYKISYNILSDGTGSIGTSSGDISDIIEDAQTDEVSKNLIYVKNGDYITNIMIEICNTKTNNMDYVSIPIRTDYTIPTSMYQKLCTVNQEIPQIVRLGRLKTYFSNEEDAYGYGELIIEKMLGVKISYYTVIDQETYNSHFEKKKIMVAYKHVESVMNELTGEMEDVTTDLYADEAISVANKTYTEELRAISGDREKIAEYIKEQYERVNSNLTVYNKIGYIEAYEKMNVDYFHYWGIPGQRNGKIFSVSTPEAKKFLNKLINNTQTYTEAQDFSKESAGGIVKSSKGLNILVLNGSQISGLASATREKLSADGYTVGNIGDYTEETLTQTRIIVKEDGYGKDLQSYFNSPELITGTVQDGYDIQIILGTVDAN